MAAPINPKGAKSDKFWRQAIMIAVNRMASDGKTKHLDLLAARLVKSAAEGDVAALREIGDRLDGKPTQEATITHDGEITHVSATVSAVDEFIEDALTSGTRIFSENPLPN